MGQSKHTYSSRGSRINDNNIWEQEVFPSVVRGQVFCKVCIAVVDSFTKQLFSTLALK